MQYRIDAKSGNKLSILGFGCMRFPKRLAQIDMDKTEQLILGAVQKGVNYFDTAYLYGGSETALGEIIKKNNLRDKIFLATKLPHGSSFYGNFEALFQEQLKRLQTDYIDYYLIHNLSDPAQWKNLCASGIEKWIKEKKSSGQIRQIGFSFHGIHNDFMTLLNGYDWDFCQIQYNYINIQFQAGVTGLKAAAAKGLPVIIMEPLLGGKLAAGLPRKAAALFNSANNSANVSFSPAAWGLRWLWNQKEVTVVLSGMNEESQLEENCGAANESVPDMLTEKETELYKSVIDIFNSSSKVACTGCNYCMPCPSGVNIPGCFAAYNMSYNIGYFNALMQYVSSTGLLFSGKNSTASNCIKCGKCEKLCPQHIPIMKSLDSVKKRMEPAWFNTLIKIFRKMRL